MKKIRIMTVSALLAVILPSLTGCGEKEVKKEETVQTIRVETGTPEARTFQRRIRRQGTVQPVYHALIASCTAGTMDVLAVEEGQKVAAGDTLFQVDQANLENQVAVADQQLAVARNTSVTAEADLEIARTKLEKAQLDYRRAEQLLQSKAISVDAFENADVNLKNANASVNKNEAILGYSKSKVREMELQLEIARKNLADSIGTAPFGGVITRKFKDQNEYVSDGTDIVLLENQDALEISCLLNAIYYSAVEVGKTRVKVLFDDNHVCEVPVSYRASFVDPLSRTFEIKVTLPKDTPLVSGTLCNLDLVLEEHAGLGLPDDAVMLRKGGEFMVYAVKDGRAEQIDVTPGISSDGFTEIRNAEKLKGYPIIIAGQYFVNPGPPVSVIKTVELASVK